MIKSLDHLVLTTRDLPACVYFYTRVLGMQLISFGEGRQALHFGTQKINLHRADAPVAPHATEPRPGALDLCLLLDRPLAEAEAHVRACHWPIELGPVPRTGAQGPIRSIYLRDPDGNLVELAEPLAP